MVKILQKGVRYGLPGHLELHLKTDDSLPELVAISTEELTQIFLDRLDWLDDNDRSAETDVALAAVRSAYASLDEETTTVAPNQLPLDIPEPEDEETEPA